MNIIWYEYGHQGQNHFEVKVIPESNFKCFDFYLEAGSGPSTGCILVWFLEFILLDTNGPSGN